MIRKIQTILLVIAVFSVATSAFVWAKAYTEVKNNLKNDNSVASSLEITTDTEDTEQSNISNTVSSEPLTAYKKTNSFELASIVQKLPGEYGIVAYNVKTGERLEYNPESEFVTASIYKLLELYPLIKKIDAGQIRWDSVIQNNSTVIDCVDTMLRYSNNECGIAVSNAVGLAYSDELLGQIGMKNTRLNNLDSNGELATDKVTTASDVLTYLKKLFYENDVNQDVKDFVLSILREQIYREGIPEGADTATVANKVGFLDDYLNDVGIVTNDTEEYILVILTRGGNWNSIATITRSINEYWQ